MEAKQVNFGNEKNITFRASSHLPMEMEETFIEYQIIEDQIYILGEQQARYGLQAETAAQKEILNHLQQYNGLSLVRIDQLSGWNVTITVFTYAGAVHFTDEELFSIVINSAIDRELRKLGIGTTQLPQFFTSEFLCKERCFAIPAQDGDLGSLTLVGENYFCKIERTKQNIMQVTNIWRRRKNNYVQGAILLLSGNIEFQDQLTHTAQQSEATQKKFIESVKDNQHLLKLWSLYSELEIEAMKQEVNELGAIKYVDADIVPDLHGKSVAVFKVEKKVPSSFYQTSLGFAVVSEEHFNAQDISSSLKSIYVGDTVLKDNESRPVGYTELRIALASDMYALPPKGYVIGSFLGSKTMADRRVRALEKIDACQTPLLDLKLLLQSGETLNPVKKKHFEPVNDELLKKIFGDKKITFTERQREAINIAVNTPDMAIIQGPPGTGKTTVIRAIIARLGKLYDGDVKILVSSAQHDAVDNAIENVEYGGLPVNRIGGRLGEAELKSGSYIWKWIRQISQNCDEILAREGVSEYRAAFRKMLLLIEECRELVHDRSEVKLRLLSIYRLLAQVDVEEDVIDQVSAVISRLERNQLVDSQAETENEAAELFRLLENQRLTKAAFQDDGPIQLAKLVRFLRLCTDFQIEIPDFWTSLRTGPDASELDELLTRYKDSLDRIRATVFGETTEAVYTDEALLEKDLEVLFTRILEDIQLKAEQTRDSLANVIWEFKDELENPQNIAEIIEKYAKINAATCQQAASRKAANVKLNSSIEYDYVIVDEAARANPLDLLIPMSLGKKIILVGDHNQLPHLLEKDIVHELVKRKRDPKAAELLQETLFARLYTMLDKTKYTEHNRTVMLNDQYRMHPVIGDFVSTFYEEPLRSAMPREEKLHQLGLYNDKPIAWLDVKPSAGAESATRHQSKSRDAEVTRLMSELHQILHANHTYTIGIITFYKSQAVKIQEQVETLTQHDQMRVSVGTVDSFQGKEFDVVILSTVRSNAYHDVKDRVGFLDSRNRLCVAFSRGKRLLIVVGDAETVAWDGERTIIKELKEFYDLCKSEGYYE